MSCLVAQKAPDFETTAVVKSEFKPWKLADQKGKWTMLFFYPLDFTFVCPTELLAVSDRYEEFTKLGVQVAGVSVDSKFSHLNWMKQPVKDGGLEGLKYPLLEDLGGQIAQKYGVLNGTVALRGMFLIDPEGVVQHATVNNLSVGRSVDESLRVIQAFQWVAEHGSEVCPADWKPGKTTMKPSEAGKKEFFSKR
jgi:peroxiredoxin (alkyl hydroperoxide reductase subunit C)